MAKYAKALVAVAAFVAALGHALVDGTISPNEWAELATTGAAAVGVWWVPNKGLLATVTPIVASAPVAVAALSATPAAPAPDVEIDPPKPAA